MCFSGVIEESETYWRNFRIQVVKQGKYNKIKYIFFSNKKTPFPILMLQIIVQDEITFLSQNPDINWDLLCLGRVSEPR